ncbi:NUDIX domain-containing protein [Modestobacter sp. SYSU DS0875]
MVLEPCPHLARSIQLWLGLRSGPSFSNRTGDGPRPAWSTRRGHHVVTGALIHQGRVLLTHRSPHRRWYPDVWDLPGGHVDDGETELDAFRRELREELGVEALTIAPEPVTRINDPAADMRLGLWVVRTWRGTPTNACPGEHDEIRWVGPGELSRLLAHPWYVGPLSTPTASPGAGAGGGAA